MRGATIGERVDHVDWTVGEDSKASGYDGGQKNVRRVEKSSKVRMEGKILGSAGVFLKGKSKLKIKVVDLGLFSRVHSYNSYQVGESLRASNGFFFGPKTTRPVSDKTFRLQFLQRSVYFSKGRVRS